MNLYRIISLETFIDILHNKHERYVRPTTWEDTFEGYLYNQLYKVEELDSLIRDIYYNVCPRNYESTIVNILKLEHAYWYVYGQSWTTIAESDAMWRIYSYNKHSVQIQTTERRLEKVLKEYENIDYSIKDVKYDVNPQDNLLHAQVKQLKDTLNVYEPFLHKRRAFCHEHEKRILIADNNWNDMLGMSVMGATWEIHEKMEGLQDDDRIEEIRRRLTEYLDHFIEENMQNNYYIKIDNISKYISGVTVNPFAEDWYVELIRNLCEEYNLKFLGRSELYRKIK